jgi:hypothetical protein
VEAVGQRELLDDRTLMGKPQGLWVSAAGKDDWLSWCRGEQFCLDRLAHRTEVSLADDARVLWVRSKSAFGAFHDQYGTEVWLSKCSRVGIPVIDWRLVARDYHGVVIAPYRWEARISDARWYYGWDCASGCIWDPAAIARLQPSEVSDGVV